MTDTIVGDTRKRLVVVVVCWGSVLWDMGRRELRVGSGCWWTYREDLGWLPVFVPTPPVSVLESSVDQKKKPSVPSLTRFRFPFHPLLVLCSCGCVVLVFD